MAISKTSDPLVLRPNYFGELGEGLGEGKALSQPLSKAHICSDGVLVSIVDLKEQCMATLYTTGFTQLPLAEFVGLLRGAGADAVVDTRLRNTSQLAGWAKRDDLAFLLRDGFGIAYEHIPLFAPTDELLDRYHADRDWDAYLPIYGALLAERPTLELGRDLFARYRAPCLLCSEPTPDR